jgi:protein-L-isoaspartate(D-aspartate) O-methyltransferase
MASDTAQLFADARKHMVDSQIRPNKVTDPRILAAMRRLPRERFLPTALASRAYADEDVPLGNGRVLMEPMLIARLLQTAMPLEGERVLVVGAGTGYSSAVLTACGCRVTALEDDASLMALARTALIEFAPSVMLVTGPLASGWAATGPYDVIVLEGGVSAIPDALGPQLHADGGRLVGVINSGRTSQAVLAEATQAGLRARPIFDCATPPLPSLVPAAAFQF